MPNMRANGINIYYEIHGSGEPLLLIQGTFDSEAWACQVPELSKKYRVITFDNRGIGGTDAPEPPYSVEEMAEDTIGLLDAIGISKAHVLGYSLGGLIALELAANRPDRVDGLIIAGSFNGVSPIVRYRTKVWTEMLRDGVPIDKVYRDFLPWVFPGGFFEDEANLEAFLKSAMNSPHPPTLHGLIGMAMAITGYYGLKDLSVIKKPTLVISGEEDLSAPAKMGRKIADGIPGSEFAVIEGATHSFIFDNAGRFNGLVLDFLGRI